MYSYVDMYNPKTLVLYSQFWVPMQSQALVLILHLLYKKNAWIGFHWVKPKATDH